MDYSEFRGEEHWQGLKKPWHIDDAASRYIYGKRIGIRSLAVLSGIPESNLNRASISGSWVEKQRQHKIDVDAETKIKIVEQQSEKLAETLGAIELEHSESFKKARRVIEIYLENVLKEVTDSGDISVIKVQDFNSMIMALKRCIDGERDALHLSNSDINVAYRVVESAGFKVTSEESEE